MSEEAKQRTLRQNKSLWLFFEMLADTLNSAGLDMRKTLKPSVNIPWSKDTIHDYLWIPVQIAMFNKESTTELETDEVSKVYDVVNRHLSEKHGVSVAFPSVETQFGGFK